MFFFKKRNNSKKNNQPKIEVKTGVSKEADIKPNSYDPWDGKDSESIYSNVSFLNILNNRTVGTTNDDYPRYISYKLSIYHPIKRHIEFINNGFLIPAPHEIMLKKLKVVELKEILKQHNLSTAGKKQDLIDLIVQNIPIESLNLKPIYVLSDKGQDYLNTYHYYIDIQKYLSDGIFTLDEFETIKKNKPYLSVNDIVWQIYNEKYNYYSVNFQHGSLRNINYLRYKLLLNDGKSKEALIYLLATMYFDINGTSKFHKYSDYNIGDWLSQSVHELASEYDSTVLQKV